MADGKAKSIQNVRIITGGCSPRFVHLTLLPRAGRTSRAWKGKGNRTGVGFLTLVFKLPAAMLSLKQPGQNCWRFKAIIRVMQTKKMGRV